MRAAYGLLLCVGIVAASTQVYSVNPVQASWSGWTHPVPGKDTVKQIITLNVDTLKQVDVFIGFNEGDGGYNVNVYSYPDGNTHLAGTGVSGLDGGPASRTMA